MKSGLGQGDMHGEFGLMQAFILGGAKAADYPATGRWMNEELGLPEPEDLDLLLEKRGVALLDRGVVVGSVYIKKFYLC